MFVKIVDVESGRAVRLNIMHIERYEATHAGGTAIRMAGTGKAWITAMDTADLDKLTGVEELPASCPRRV